MQPTAALLGVVTVTITFDYLGTLTLGADLLRLYIREV
jgi:hypothetical protein